MQVRYLEAVEGVYPTGGDYVHGIEMSLPERLVLVSGTMGLKPDGRAEEGAKAQIARIWQNISTILAEADMTLDNIVRVTSYLTDSAFREVNQDARVNALKGRAVPTTALVVETLESDWLVEIEVIAAA